MAYFERFFIPDPYDNKPMPANGYFRRGHHKHGRIFCDPCAESNGEVPFKPDSAGVLGQQRPWCWVPRYGCTCGECGGPC